MLWKYPLRLYFFFFPLLFSLPFLFFPTPPPYFLRTSVLTLYFSSLFPLSSPPFLPSFSYSSILLFHLTLDCPFKKTPPSSLANTPHTLIFSCMHTCFHIHMYAYTHACTHACTHAHRHILAHTCTHACMHTHTHTCTLMQSHAHYTYMNTQLTHAHS